SYLTIPSRRPNHIPGDHTRQTQIPVSSFFSVDELRPESRLRGFRPYQPTFYPGKISFVRAQVVTDFPYDPAAVWDSLASEIVVETVPGDHLEIMTTHYAQLAAVLSRLVREALR